MSEADAIGDIILQLYAILFEYDGIWLEWTMKAISEGYLHITDLP